MNSGDTTERKKQKLIDLGKSKGFLTYDEVNDNMPEDIVSSDQIDDWLSALGDEGIEIVDSASKVRVSSKVPTPKVADAIEEDEKEEEEADDDYDSGDSKTNDPVRMYLRKMGSVSLLTREGEVEIAKRIEEGERRVLQTVLNSPIAVEELLLLGERLKKQKVRVKEVGDTDFLIGEQVEKLNTIQLLPPSAPRMRGLPALACATQGCSIEREDQTVSNSSASAGRKQ